MSSIVIKRDGHDEKYDELKLSSSVLSTNISCGVDQKTAETIAQSVVRAFNEWLGDKKHVTSTEIRSQVYELIRPYSSDVAFVYQKHRNVK